MSAATKDTAAIHPCGRKIQVAPGEALVDWPIHFPVPEKCGVFEWQETSPGNYQPKVRLHSRLVRMRATVTDDLGLGIAYNSLRRLMRAGFVRSLQVTPGQYAFDLQSFKAHCAAVEADPEFWTGKNLRRYNETLE